MFGIQHFRTFLLKTRRRFRLPYEQYLELIEDSKFGKRFPNWEINDATGKESSPLELMLFRSSRYFGRGWAFNHIEEATAILEETHKRFLLAFVKIGSTILFDKYNRPT
jgi:hypothetical protein